MIVTQQQNLVLMSILVVWPICFIVAYYPVLPTPFHSVRSLDNPKNLSTKQQLFFKLKSFFVCTDNIVEDAAAEAGHERKVVGNMAFLVSSRDADLSKSKFGGGSPYGNPSILEAVGHLVQKSYYWSDGSVEAEVFKVTKNMDPAITAKLANIDVLIAIGLQAEYETDFAASLFEERFNRSPSLRQRQCQFILDSSKSLASFVSTFDLSSLSLVANFFPWTKAATARRLYEQMTVLFDRWTSDDFCYAIMIFFNQFSGFPIDWVRHSIDATWEKGPIRNAKELYSMFSKCGDCIAKCVQDEKCRKCIQRLTAIDSRDQVTSYRTIVSFESDLLKDFSRCILTKNNIFNCSAKIPTIPKVAPITTFRGAQVTEQIARSILVGHLDHEIALEGSLKKVTSWLVACGANIAYDQFPSQNQVFYPVQRGRDMWYDPIFRVNTIDGKSVWCKRHYKVRPQKVIATFRFSVLDNGVTSDELWTIVGVADDLSWIVFHYAGAATAVGMQYLGGLLCTPDGNMPDKSKLLDIWKCFRSAGIQPWELYMVDNRRETPSALEAGTPPLDFFRGAIRHITIEAASDEN